MRPLSPGPRYVSKEYQEACSCLWEEYYPLCPSSASQSDVFGSAPSSEAVRLI